MHKKTLNTDIWEILGYDSEDYRDLIREAGFDPDELYENFGCFVEELENPSSKSELKNDFRDFYYSPGRKSDVNENGEKHDEAMDFRKYTGNIFEEGLIEDTNLSNLFTVLKKERGVMENN